MATHRITRIEPQKRRKDRFSIFVDDEFALGVDADLLVEFHLAEGLELDDDALAEIRAANERRRALERAYRLLAARDRSEHEMRTRLKEIGFEQAVIEETVAKLRERGYLNDSRFAVDFARSQLATHPVGRRELEWRLRQKGLADPIVASAVETAYGERNERSLALELAKARLRRYRNEPDERKVKKRVADFLARRGFNWEIVSEILDQWDSLRSDDTQTSDDDRP